MKVARTGRTPPRPRAPENGGHDTHIDRCPLERTQTLDRSLREGPEQCPLGARRKVSNLIEEQGASVRSRDKPIPLARRSGKCPSLVPEQLRKSKPGGQRSTIDRNERPVRATGGGVDATRNPLLARSRLAVHEDGKPCRCKARDRLPQPYDGRAASVDAVAVHPLPTSATATRVQSSRPSAAGRVVPSTPAPSSAASASLRP